MPASTLIVLEGTIQVAVDTDTGVLHIISNANGTITDLGVVILESA